ncbi:MAG: hypothetical protein JO244_05815 [Solirubrobacterales bacterium]|nr:hypothetical protein [Solirubrobacterales bacterium]
MTLRKPLIVCGLVCALLSLAGGKLAAARPAHGADRAARTFSPRGVGPAPSIFGINTGTYDTSRANFARDLPTARGLGARWVHFTGDSIHFSRSGRPNYGTLDYEVSHATRLGLGVLVSLGGTPRACSIQPRPADPSICPPTTGHDLRAYQPFLRGVLLRYRNRVQYWESWLEPNHKAFWQSGPNPQQYANLLSAQYQVVQSVNRQYHLHMQLLFAGPADFSIIPGSPGGMPVLPFTHQVLVDLHGQHVFDAIGLHAYRFPPATTGPWVRDYDSVKGIPAGGNGPYPAQGCVSSPWCQMTWSEELSAYEQEFADQGYGGMPLWLTEFGWPGTPQAGDGYHPSYAAQAADLSAAYQALLGLPFLKAAFWFNLRDCQPGNRNPDPEFFGHYGLLQYHFAPKPAAKVFERLARANPGR